MKARLLLLHFGNKRDVAEFILLKSNQGNRSNMSDQESDDIHGEKSQEKPLLGKMIIHI